MKVFNQVPTRHHAHGPKKIHNKTKKCEGNQCAKKLVKQTNTSRSMVFALKGPIFRLCSHKVVRNCYLIFILHMMFLYRDILELTHTTLEPPRTAPLPTLDIGIPTQEFQCPTQVFQRGFSNSNLGILRLGNRLLYSDACCKSRNPQLKILAELS